MVLLMQYRLHQTLYRTEGTAEIWDKARTYPFALALHRLAHAAALVERVLRACSRRPLLLHLRLPPLLYGTALRLLALLLCFTRLFLHTFEE